MHSCKPSFAWTTRRGGDRSFPLAQRRHEIERDHGIHQPAAAAAIKIQGHDPAQRTALGEPIEHPRAEPVIDAAYAEAPGGYAEAAGDEGRRCEREAGAGGVGEGEGAGGGVGRGACEVLCELSRGCQSFLCLRKIGRGTYDGKLGGDVEEAVNLAPILRTTRHACIIMPLEPVQGAIRPPFGPPAHEHPRLLGLIVSRRRRRRRRRNEPRCGTPVGGRTAESGHQDGATAYDAELGDPVLEVPLAGADRGLHRVPDQGAEPGVGPGGLLLDARDQRLARVGVEEGEDGGEDGAERGVLRPGSVVGEQGAVLHAQSDIEEADSWRGGKRG